MWWFNQFFNLSIFPFCGDGGRKTKTKINKLKNDVITIVILVRMILTALARYDFEGLPDTVSKRVVLQSLLWYGNVIFFEKNGALLALPGTPAGDGINVYGDFGSAYVYSRNGKLNEQIKIYIPGSDDAAFLGETLGSKTPGNPRGVCVWENEARFPFLQTVMMYADMVADTYRTLDTARFWLKRPVVFTAEESEVETINRFIRDMENNNEYAISSGILGKETKIIETHTDTAHLDGCTTLIEWYENKFRELCGIRANSQIDKKGENLIQAELTVNEEYEGLSVGACIATINRCLDDVNRLFGTSIKCVKKEYTDGAKISDVSGGLDGAGSGDGVPGGDPA